MTTTAAAREAIYQHFVNAWGATAFTFDNEAYEPPAVGPWARFSVRHSGGSQETLGAVGGRRFSRTGSIVVEIFTRVDEGLAAADALITTARDAFEGARIVGTTVRFRNARAQDVGVSGKWLQTNVVATFEYDETR